MAGLPWSGPGFCEGNASCELGKLAGEKKPDFLKILCGDQHLNLAIQGLLIQCKWKIVTFAEECDSAQREVAGCFGSRGLEPRRRLVFRSHVD